MPQVVPAEVLEVGVLDRGVEAVLQVLEGRGRISGVTVANRCGGEMRALTLGPTASIPANIGPGVPTSATAAAIDVGLFFSLFANGKHDSERSPRSGSGVFKWIRTSASSIPTARAAAAANASSYLFMTARFPFGESQGVTETDDRSGGARLAASIPSRLPLKGRAATRGVSDPEGEQCALDIVPPSFPLPGVDPGQTGAAFESRCRHSGAA